MLKTINNTINLPILFGAMIVGLIVEARVLNVLGIMLGHWVYPQANAGTDPPINPLDPLVGLVLFGAFALGSVLYRRYRSMALGIILSAPITWAFIVLISQGAMGGQ